MNIGPGGLPWRLHHKDHAPVVFAADMTDDPLAGFKGCIMRKIVLSLALLLAGCATITKGTSQIVTIETPGVSQAECVVSTAVGPQTVNTPGTIVLNKASASLPVRCNKPCYHEGVGVIASSVEVMSAGNLVVGGVVGIGVDAISGAMHKYPDSVQVVMIPIPGCGAAAPARKR